MKRGKWLDEELLLLKTAHDLVSVQEIGKRLNRSAAAVAHKCKRLNLPYEWAA